jgi:hypothetical protein
MFDKALWNLCFSHAAVFNDEIYFFAFGATTPMFEGARIDTSSGAADAAYTLH